jgi:gas vesicle protein
MSSGNSRDNFGGSVTIALFAGLAIGAVIGILFAPKSGKETRKELVEKGERFLEMSKEGFSEVVEKTKDLTEAGKQKFEELKIAGEEILEKGKKKAATTAKKIKLIVDESKAAAKKTEEFLS